MQRPIVVLLIVAALLRLVGVAYGLPLWLVGDEPSFIFGALKMMELQSVIPALHTEEFLWTFYYPPYLSYLYLLPFAAVAGVKYLFFSGTFAEFLPFLQIDLSHFFLAARALSAAIGTATVYIVYRVGKNIFTREREALFAAAFFAFSFLHVNFSHWGRHWVPATFILSFVLFCLSHPSWNIKKRYLMASLAAGIGMGVTQQVGLVTVLIALWFFIVDSISFKVFREWWPWQCVGIFFALTGISYLLWPPGFYVAAGAGDYITRGKTLAGLVSGYGFYVMNLVKSEPVFLLFLLAGSLVFWKTHRRLLSVFAMFTIIYIAAFYFLFLHVDRFLLMLYPLLALLAGAGLARAAQRKLLVGATFALLLFPVLRYDFLLVKNDTRIRAMAFLKQELPADARVMVLAAHLRLPATAASIDEQEAIDPASIRSVDNAERAAKDALVSRRFHALNLSVVRNIDFLANISEYIQSRGYQYVVYEPSLAEERVGAAFEEQGETIAEFLGYAESGPDAIVNGVGDGWKQLWRAESIGPDIIIKKF